MSKNNIAFASDALEELYKIRNEIPSSKTRRKIDKSIEELKRVMNKFYYHAFYDYRFECCNYNKLLDDIKALEEKKGFKLLFVRIPGMTRSFYLKNQVLDEIMTLISEYKNYINSNREKFATPNIYIVDNYIVCIPRTKYVQEVYYNFKEKKETHGDNFGIVYVSYHAYSSKVNKNINFCIQEAIRITKEIPLKEIKKIEV